MVMYAFAEKKCLKGPSPSVHGPNCWGRNGVVLVRHTCEIMFNKCEDACEEHLLPVTFDGKCA